VNMLVARLAKLVTTPRRGLLVTDSPRFCGAVGVRTGSVRTRAQRASGGFEQRPGVPSKMPSLETSGAPRQGAVAAIHPSGSCSRWHRAYPMREISELAEGVLWGRLLIGLDPPANGRRPGHLP